ncbi:PDZ domain-containing protein [Leptotrichia sp. OH3620_COT-345]|uniref:M50 family metallopeptidase n=1 Tax=Leptotrichia sp. OH3620_COT-345 TaxID=2491048 RepID=UPI000F64AADF|nr:M50 family metallopeptidase [Leptotrichia sp. OH3620_COT-345]RRD39398.1 PDZ domain-containing protein [Leptotrichia sp. OH3620_COT-345]
MSILFTILILGLIIFLHELGHFLTAKYYKMPVIEFAIGMGPKLFSKKINETTYSIRILPLGGFVNIGGMQPEEGGEQKFENGFYTKPPFSRFVVLIAGIVMNFVSAIIVIFILFSITGVIPPKFIEPVIGSVNQETAVKSAFKPNDRIIEINGEKINNWRDIALQIGEINQKGYNGEDVAVKIIRENKEINQKVKLTYYEKEKVNLLGIQAVKTNVSVFRKIHASFSTFGDYFILMINGLKMLLTGKVSMQEVTGPIGLPKFVGEAYKAGGGFGLINIFILLSINIGLMNLLPIPALDGGRILFVIPEFFGIKVNKKIEERIHAAGMLLLFGLMIFMLFNDAFKYFK